MTRILDESKWDDVTLLTRTDRVEGGITGASNRQARQLANRTRKLKDDLESMVDYKEYTFYKTPQDPDGTISGLAGTPHGKGFRVAQGTGSDASFIYYRNDNGSAVAVTQMPGIGMIDNAMELSKEAINIIYNDFDDILESIDYDNSGAAYSWHLDSEHIAGIKITRISLPVLSTPPLVFHMADGEGVFYSFTMLPGEMIVSGKYYGRYNKFTIANGVFQSLVSGSSVSRARFNMNWNAIGGLPGQDDNTISIYDRSLALAAVSAGKAESATVDSISYSTATGGFQIIVINSNVINAGYSLNESGVRNYINERYAGLTLEAIKLGGAEFVKDVRDIYFTRDGVLDISTNRGLTFIAEIKQRRRVSTSTQSAIENTAHIRLSCNVKNNLSHDMIGELIKIAVNFEPGQVPCQECINVSDYDGNYFNNIQFMEEIDVNSRHRASMGYHSDGSLRSGYVCFRDSINTGKEKTYILRCYQNKNKDQLKYSLINSGSGYTLVIGDYTYTFSKSAANQLISASIGNETFKVAISDYVGYKTAAGVYSEGQVSSSGATIKIINAGPLWCEVEVVNFNGGLGTLGARKIRMTTRYKFFLNGEISINCVTDVVGALADGELLGAYTRIDFDAKVPTTGYNWLNALWETTHGTKQSASIVYTNGDLHRGGELQGPRRPEHASMAIASGTGALRAQAGWRYNAVPAVAPAPEIGWAWTSGILIKLADYNESVSSLGSRVNNPLIGFAGKGIHEYVQRQRIMDRIAEFCLGYTQFWEHDATALDTGDGISNCYGSDLVNLYKYGIGSFDNIYNSFDSYCKKRYIGIASLGQAYKNKKLPLQYASRVLAQPLWWLYKHAVSIGDASRANVLLAGITGLADALTSTYQNNGGIPLVWDNTTKGGSNSNATGYRFMCMAVATGHDPNNEISSALSSMDSMFMTSYALTENIITDALSERLPVARYIHYQAYAYNNYFIGCQTANKTPILDMSNYLMNGTSAYGAIKDVEYCISESRRGDINTPQFCLHSHIYQGGLTGIHFANAIMNNLDEALGPEPGKPRRLWDFQEDIVTSDLRLPIGFALNIFADTWLFDYYSKK